MGDNTINVDELLRPATEQERRDWPGWVQLQGEPWMFNEIMRDLGADNLVWTEYFPGMPGRMYAAVLVGTPTYSMTAGQAPYFREEIWFARQLIADACGSIAIINSVLNMPDELFESEILQDFLEETAILNPVQRGEDIAEFAQLRMSHNMCAKKMEMLLQDHSVASGFNPETTQVPNPQTQALGQTSTAKKVPTTRLNHGDHFVAYVPIGNELWCLNGLDQWPRFVGDLNQDPAVGDWVMDVACQAAFLTQDVEQLNQKRTKQLPAYHAVLVLKDNPLTLLPSLIAAIQAVAGHLDILEDANRPEIAWRFYFTHNTPYEQEKIPDEYKEFFLGPSRSLGITQVMIDASEIPPEYAVPDGASHEELENLYHIIADTQRSLVDQIRAQEAAVASDVFDYQYLIIRWLEMLDSNGRLARMFAPIKQKQEKSR